MNLDWLLPVIVIVVLVALLISMSIVGWIVESHYKAKAFNEVTGSNVTTKQAMWIELRVQEETTKLNDESAK